MKLIRYCSTSDLKIVFLVFYRTNVPLCIGHVGKDALKLLSIWFLLALILKQLIECVLF